MVVCCPVKTPALPSALSSLSVHSASLILSVAGVQQRETMELDAALKADMTVLVWPCALRGRKVGLASVVRRKMNALMATTTAAAPKTAMTCPTDITALANRDTN